MKIHFGVLLTKWRTALLCAVIYFHHFGMMRVVSLLFVATTERYSVDRNKASYPYVMRLTVGTLMGPIIGYLGCKFRFDRLIKLGCFVVALGIALCFCAESIIMVTVCWGLLLGIGQGMTSTATLLVNRHYKNDISVANGISFAGASIGGIVYTIITKIFLDEYLLSGSFLLLSAISLHSVPAAMLLTDSRFTRSTLKRKKNFQNVSTEKKENLQEITYNKGALGRNVVCRNEDSNKDEACIYVISYTNILPLHTDQIIPSDSIPVEVDNQKVDPYHCSLSFNNDLQEIPIHTLMNQTAKHISQCCSSYGPKSESIGKEIRKKETKEHVLYFKRRKKDDVSMNLKDASFSPSTIRKQKKKTREALRLFYEPLFILIAFLQSSYLGLLILQTTTIGDYIVDKGFTMNDAAVLLVWCSIADFCGRLSLGCVTDRGFMSLSNFGATLHIVVGICFVAIALSAQKTGLNIASFICSLAMGGLMNVYPAIICENFDGDLKTIALSSRFILFLPISFIAPALIGYFREQLGSYLWLYYTMAGFCGIFALLFLLLPSIQKYRKM